MNNLYLKNAFGLGDFRLHSFEAIQKQFAVVVLAINHLQYRMALAYHSSPAKATLADFTHLHRLEHFQLLLRSVLQPYTQPPQIESCLQAVVAASPGAIV